MKNPDGSACGGTLPGKAKEANRICRALQMGLCFHGAKLFLCKKFMGNERPAHLGTGGKTPRKACTALFFRKELQKYMGRCYFYPYL